MGVFWSCVVIGHGPIYFQRRLRRSRPLRLPVVELFAAGSRNFFIQRRHSGSLPSITSAPHTAVISSVCSGFMIAEVMPAPIAIVRNAAFKPCRFGRPKKMFDAPQMVFTASSS